MKLHPGSLMFSWAIVLLVLGVTAAPATIHVTITPAPNRPSAASFELDDASGKKASLSQYRGKVVLFDFWATACGGCVKEMPVFMDLARTYKANEFAVIGVSVDILYESLKNSEEGWSKVRPFIQSHNVNYPILMADDIVTKAYKIRALPLTLLIDKRGKVAATYSGLVDPTNLEANIKALLTESK